MTGPVGQREHEARRFRTMAEFERVMFPKKNEAERRARLSPAERIAEDVLKVLRKREAKP